MFIGYLHLQIVTCSSLKQAGGGLEEVGNMWHGSITGQRQRWTRKAPLHQEDMHMQKHKTSVSESSLSLANVQCKALHTANSGTLWGCLFFFFALFISFIIFTQTAVNKKNKKSSQPGRDHNARYYDLQIANPNLSAYRETTTDLSTKKVFEILDT